MPEKLICPSCNKDSYTAAPETYNPCPHCNFIFNKSTSMGPDKRSEHRFNWTTYCKVFSSDLSGDNAFLVAKTVDVSQQGAMIRYVGEHLKTGSRVDVHISDLDIYQAAEIIWSKGGRETNMFLGLRFYEQVALKFLSRKERVTPLSLSSYIHL